MRRRRCFSVHLHCLLLLLTVPHLVADPPSSVPMRRPRTSTLRLRSDHKAPVRSRRTLGVARLTAFSGRGRPPPRRCVTSPLYFLFFCLSFNSVIWTNDRSNGMFSRIGRLLGFAVRSRPAGDSDFRTGCSVSRRTRFLTPGHLHGRCRDFGRA